MAPVYVYSREGGFSTSRPYVRSEPKRGGESGAAAAKKVEPAEASPAAEQPKDPPAGDSAVSARPPDSPTRPRARRAAEATSAAASATPARAAATGRSENRKAASRSRPSGEQPVVRERTPTNVRTAAELESLGVPEETIDYWVRIGALIRTPNPGVLLETESAGRWLGQFASAALAAASPRRRAGS